MSNDALQRARLFNLFTKVGEMVIDGTRDAGLVADYIQRIIDPSLPLIAPVVSAEPVEKFTLLEDLGYIIVPEGNPAICLGVFKERNHEKFRSYDDAITDINFSKPTRILNPGDKLRLRAFRQISSETTTSEERIEFLRQQKGNVFVGAQGLTYVFDQKLDQLPKGYWYASFDEKDRLYSRNNFHKVPGLGVRPFGGSDLMLDTFEERLGRNRAFFSFCEEVSFGS